MTGAALDDLRAARTSDGAPSARNLIVTVFGDALLPHGARTEISVRSLTELLAGFGVSERLVRTSLTRLVNDDLLTARAEGRRSFYRVEPAALDLFARADDRIYRGDVPEWDGHWTVVVIDGAEATRERRARLRQELSWAGMGVVAPNVMASPVLAADVVAGIVRRVGGLTHVLVSRSEVVDAPGTLGADELARRCLDIDAVAGRYGPFVDRFASYDDATIAALDHADAFKLRVLAVAAFRRLVLAEPLIPVPLRPPGWVGDAARRTVAALYGRIGERAERFLLDRARPPLSPRAPAGVADRFVIPR